MNNKCYRVIGVMSGTSLDGVDLAYCQFSVSEGKEWNFKFIKTETVDYPEYWKRELRLAIDHSEENLMKMDEKYTEYLGETIDQFIYQNDIKELDAICSHGHTIKHQPQNGITIQIGNRSNIATITGNKVICDFRVQDVKLGGQGAPLVPIGDQLLFKDYNYCLNLGGFANLSHDLNGNRIAYDVCPVNIVMNHYMRALGLPYDDQGKLARSGDIDSMLLKELNELEFYAKDPPKSLGLEWVLSSIFPIISRENREIKDLLHTFVEHIAFQISKQFTPHCSVLVTGGGAYNSYLIDRLKELSNIEIVRPSNELIEYKEALIFGLLGILKLRDENNCLASVTGAEIDHSSGTIFYPK